MVNGLMQLVFTKSRNAPEWKKIKEFWQFIGKNVNLQPYMPPLEPRESREKWRKSTQMDKDEEFDVGINSDAPFNSRKSEIDFAVSSRCPEKTLFRSSSLKLADQIEESYEDLNNELLAFEKRNRTPKKDPWNPTDEDSWEELVLSCSAEIFEDSDSGK